MSRSQPLDLSADVTRSILEDCLAAFPHVRVSVTGDCMEPALRAGETVLICGRAARRPRWGDVVLAVVAGELRLHRLVWAPRLAGSNAGWRTKPDRGRFLDPWIRRTDVLGSVVAVERRGETRPWGRLRAVTASLSGGLLSRARHSLLERLGR